MRILIIDDDQRVGNTLADVLALDGHTPAVAHSGTEGLERLASDPPEAVFLDVVMPGLSGLEVLGEIRRRHPKLPVVVLTGKANSDEVEEARRLGATEVLIKPWPLKHLDEALQVIEAERFS
jgi:DNA-binding NtrC family response regulator